MNFLDWKRKLYQDPEFRAVKRRLFHTFQVENRALRKEIARHKNELRLIGLGFLKLSEPSFRFWDNEADDYYNDEGAGIGKAERGAAPAAAVRA